MTTSPVPDLREAAAPSARRRLISMLGPLIGLAVIVFLGGVVQYIKQGTFGYWSPQNQCMLLSQTVTVAVGAIGMTMIIISGGIDLSAGSTIALAACTAGWIIRHFTPHGLAALEGSQALWLPALALAAALGMGALVGTVNGTLITSMRLPPFIVTLGMLTFARGTAKWISGQTKIDVPANWITDFARTNLNPWMITVDWGPFQWRGPMVITAALVVAVALAVLVAVLLGRTRFGRHVFAIGSNEATARLCGVRVERTKIIIYALAGAMIGLAGIVDFGRQSAADPTTAMGKELDIIAAVVIGGGSLSGGAGSIFGSLIGALLMAHLQNLCVHLGLPNFVQEQVVGPVIIVAVTLDRLRQRKRE